MCLPQILTKFHYPTAGGKLFIWWIFSGATPNLESPSPKGERQKCRNFSTPEALSIKISQKMHNYKV
jgi:hypothetical protein